MRKWMRDRMQRRKKAAESAKTSPSPAPLQPAYFSAGAPDEASGIPTAEAVQNGERDEDSLPEKSAPVSDVNEGMSEPNTSSESESSGAAQPQAKTQPRRRRRSRGGRGRRQNAADSTSPAQQPTAPPEPQAAPVQLQDSSPADAPAVATPPRPSKGVVVLAIGLPGSGKSSWFKRHNITPLSSDLLRALLFDDPTEQRYQDLVFSNLRSMLKARLIARRPMNYVDATNLTSHDRRGWIKLAKDYGYEVQAVFFDVPLDVCLARNQKRQRVVADDVMRRMSAKMKAPTFEEGFTKITVVRVKQRDEG